MSRWSDQFDNHQIHDTIKTLQDWLIGEIEGIDSEHEEERRRLAKGLRLIKDALDGQDPELFPEKLMANLNNQLRQPQIWNEIESYSSSRNIHNLRNANDYLTNQMPLVHQAMALSGPPKAAKTIRSIEEAYEKFCKAIEQAEHDFASRLSNSEAELNEIQERLAAHKSELENLKRQSDEAFREWQGEFGEAQNSRAEEFSSAQIQRGERFDELMRDIRNKSEVASKEISDKQLRLLDESYERFKSEIHDRLEDMRAKHVAILEIHGLVGTDGVAGGYQKTATDEGIAANTWRRVAMAALICAVLWLGVRFYLGFEAPSAKEINWIELFATASLTLVLLATAGYASLQSRIHRDLEQQMRWFSLEVKAIDPFLSSLDDADRKDLKKQLSERIFGKDRTSNQSRKNSVDAAAYKEITNSIMSPLQEILKLLGKGQ